MPDVAMATASFGQMQLAEQTELELDLGDGNIHSAQLGHSPHSQPMMQAPQNVHHAHQQGLGAAPNHGRHRYHRYLGCPPPGVPPPYSHHTGPPRFI